MAMTHLQAFKAALVALWTSWRDWFVGSPEQADEEDGYWWAQDLNDLGMSARYIETSLRLGLKNRSEAWLRGAWRWVQDQEPA
jgi:hypothetical protein